LLSLSRLLAAMMSLAAGRGNHLMQGHPDSSALAAGGELQQPGPPGRLLLRPIHASFPSCEEWLHSAHKHPVPTTSTQPGAVTRYSQHRPKRPHALPPQHPSTVRTPHGSPLPVPLWLLWPFMQEPAHPRKLVMMRACVRSTSMRRTHARMHAHAHLCACMHAHPHAPVHMHLREHTMRVCAFSLSTFPPLLHAPALLLSPRTTLLSIPTHARILCWGGAHTHCRCGRGCAQASREACGVGLTSACVQYLHTTHPITPTFAQHTAGRPHPQA